MLRTTREGPPVLVAPLRREAPTHPLLHQGPLLLEVRLLPEGPTPPLPLQGLPPLEGRPLPEAPTPLLLHQALLLQVDHLLLEVLTRLARQEGRPLPVVPTLLHRALHHQEDPLLPEETRILRPPRTVRLLAVVLLQDLHPPVNTKTITVVMDMIRAIATTTATITTRRARVMIRAPAMARHPLEAPLWKPRRRLLWKRPLRTILLLH